MASVQGELYQSSCLLRSRSLAILAWTLGDKGSPSPLRAQGLVTPPGICSSSSIGLNRWCTYQFLFIFQSPTNTAFSLQPPSSRPGAPGDSHQWCPRANSDQLGESMVQCSRTFYTMDSCIPNSMFRVIKLVLETGHGGSIYTMEISKRYNQALLSAYYVPH